MNRNTQCPSPLFEPCRSRWFWLSPYRAIERAACPAPADLGLVDAWILARQTGDGDDGCRILGEIFWLNQPRARLDGRDTHGLVACNS